MPFVFFTWAKGLRFIWDLASEAEVGVARECTPIERPAEVLEIEPIMEDTNSPGYWFKFDDAEAKAYFKKRN